MPRYVPCFLAGVICYRISIGRDPTLPGWTWPLFVAAITFVYLVKPSGKMAWIYCLALGLGIPFFRELRSPWLGFTCRLIAKYSYAIYLLHFICLWLAFQAFPGLPAWLRPLTFFALLVPLSVAAYHAIEFPFIKMDKRLTAGPTLRIPLPSRGTLAATPTTPHSHISTSLAASPPMLSAEEQKN